MIPNDLRCDLIEALTRVPLVGQDDDAGRTGLLVGIPQTGFFKRNQSSVRGDVTLLVAQLEETFSPRGEWRLLQFIDNAVPSVENTDLGRELKGIRQKLEQVQKGAYAGVVHPAEVAQVHLFDLRKVVITCIGQLPDQAAVSGFVLSNSTPRLLGYLCESLRHRGVELRAWSRDQVAPTRPPLELDPLHTTVDVAAANALKMRLLLAKKHVIWSAYVKVKADAEALWQAIAAGFGQSPDHHLLVILGVAAGVEAPQKMVPLPPIKFTPQDVASWVGDIARCMAWHEALVERWTGVIIKGYTANKDDLPINSLYDKLERHRALVTENKTLEALVKALDDLELIGE